MNELASTTDYDFVVVGAGIVGCAVARVLTGRHLRVGLIEARDDVGDGTSKANTAILHTGFDAKPGTLESRMVARGYKLLSDYARRTGIPVEATGALLVAWTDEELAALPSLRAKAADNGYTHCEIVGADEVYRQVPALGAGALGGLTVPDESIICTWTTNLALATEAVERGAVLHTATRAESITVAPDHTVLHTSSGDISARWVVNAAGLGADYLDQAFGYDRFHVTPRRGELLVYDKLARALIDKIVLPVPTALGKGVLVSPTIYGNVMLGPTAEDLDDRSATGTSEEGFAFLLEKGHKLVPRLLEEEVTAAYAGLRAAADHSDYLVDVDVAQRYVLLGGIRSTGLTSGMAVAEYLDELLQSDGVLTEARTDLPEPPHMPNIGEAFLRPYRDATAITADPAYGKVVCFCERVTAGEIRDAYASLIPPRDLNGLRRRTRVMNGRCQGFFCGAEVSVQMDSRHYPRANPIHTVTRPQVAVIGAGPAGLAAATRLASTFGRDVLVLDRETTAGGIPRHCDHPGYGIRDMHTFIGGPAYARRLVERARAAGVRILTDAMVTAIHAGKALDVTTPSGLLRVEPDALILAMGARERPRSARLVPGDRPSGVYTTGQLQNVVHVHHGTVGTRAVVVGAELVSWSAVMTLRHAHCSTVLMTTTQPSPESYAAFNIPGRALLRVPVATRTRVTRIIGRPKVEGVEVEHLDTGERRIIDCDTVVFTGDWIPDHELVRGAGIELDPGTKGPLVDTALRTSQDGVFAAGNLLHPVDTADIAALDGTFVADQVAAYLDGATAWKEEGVRIIAKPPFRWIAPSLLRTGAPAPPRDRLLLWTDRLVRLPKVTVSQSGRVITSKRLPWPASPGRVFRIPFSLLDGVVPAGGDVTIGLEGHSDSVEPRRDRAFAIITSKR